MRCSGRKRTHDPSVSHRRPRLGCFLGTFNPSRRQIRSTRLVVDQPAGAPQQSRDLAIAVTAILPGKLDDVGRQPLLVIAALRRLALRRAVLAERRASATLGYAKLTTNTLDAGTATRRAQ